MTSIKRILTLVIAIMVLGLTASAQSTSDKPIKWRMTVKMTSATEGVVTLRAVVGQGWHLYGTTLPKNGPIPTTFDFSASKGVSFINDFTPSAKPVSHKDEMFGMTLNWWASNVNFTRKFKLTGNIKDALIKGSVRYMGCNDSNCLPPATENFTVTPKPFTSK